MVTFIIQVMDFSLTYWCDLASYPTEERMRKGLKDFRKTARRPIRCIRREDSIIDLDANPARQDKEYAPGAQKGAE